MAIEGMTIYIGHNYIGRNYIGCDRSRSVRSSTRTTDDSFMLPVARGCRSRRSSAPAPRLSAPVSPTRHSRRAGRSRAPNSEFQVSTRNLRYARVAAHAPASAPAHCDDVARVPNGGWRGDQCGPAYRRSLRARHLPLELMPPRLSPFPFFLLSRLNWRIR